MKITATKTLQLYYITPLISLHANELGDNSPRGCQGVGLARRVEGPHAASVAHKIEQNTCKVRQRQRESERASEKSEKSREKMSWSRSRRRGSSYSMTPLLTPLQLSGMPARLYLRLCVYVSVCVMERAAKGMGKNLGTARFSWQDTALRVYYLILSTSCVEISSHKSMKRLAQVYN